MRCIGGSSVHKAPQLPLAEVTCASPGEAQAPPHPGGQDKVSSKGPSGSQTQDTLSSLHLYPN